MVTITCSLRFPRALSCIGRPRPSPLVHSQARLSQATTSPVKRSGERSFVLCRSTDPNASQGPEETVYEDMEELLDEEDDWVVPGGAGDSMSPNTPLGKAIRSACDELEHLNKMEMDSLQQAQGLLAKLGYKGDIFQGRPVNSLDLEGLGDDNV